MDRLNLKFKPIIPITIFVNFPEQILCRYLKQSIWSFKAVKSHIKVQYFQSRLYSSSYCSRPFSNLSNTWVAFTFPQVHFVGKICSHLSVLYLVVSRIYHEEVYEQVSRRQGTNMYMDKNNKYW